MAQWVGFIAAFATISAIIFVTFALFRDWFEYMETVDKMDAVIRLLERELEKNCMASNMTREDGEEQA